MTPQTAATTRTSALTTADLLERAIHRRAVETVIWRMPAVNAEFMFQAMADANSDFNQVTYWSRPVTSKNQTLTPNPDTIYLNPFYNTKDGPIVLEIPAANESGSITGSVDDAWQTAIEDIGPAGVDKGRVASTRYCRPATTTKFLTASFPCSHGPTRLMRTSIGHGTWAPPAVKQVS